jgi:hypothetical protein
MAAAEGAPAAGGLDVGAIITQVVGGGVGGGALTVIAGLIKSMMQKLRPGTRRIGVRDGSLP